MRHERAGQYDRLSRAGALNGMVTAAPSPEEKRRARLVGTAGLTLGLGLFALIVYAVVR